MSALSAPEQLCKAPDEIRHFQMDFTNWLGSSETLTSVSGVTSQLIGGGTSDLDIDSDTILSGSKKVQFRIQGGSKNKRYCIFVAVNTSDSNTLVGEGKLRVTR